MICLKSESTSVLSYPKLFALIGAVFVGPLAWNALARGLLAPKVYDYMWMFGIIDGLCVWLIHPLFTGSLAEKLIRSYGAFILTSLVCGLLQQTLGLGIALAGPARHFESLATAEQHLMFRTGCILTGVPTVLLMGLITAARIRLMTTQERVSLQAESPITKSN